MIRICPGKYEERTEHPSSEMVDFWVGYDGWSGNYTQFIIGSVRSVEMFWERIAATARKPQHIPLLGKRNPVWEGLRLRCFPMQETPSNKDTPLSASLRIVRMYLDLDCTNPERRVHPANLTWTSPSQNLPSKQFRLVWSCDNLRLHHNFALCETNMLKHHACWGKFHIDVCQSQGPTIPDNPVNPKPDWTQVLISPRHLVDTVPILGEFPGTVLLKRHPWSYHIRWRPIACSSAKSTPGNVAFTIEFYFQMIF